MTMLASCAPDAPAVIRAIRLTSISFSLLIFFKWTFKIASLPIKSGSSTRTCRSKRPGRRRAGSRTSGLLVAASMMTPLLLSKPSISVSNWFKVCSRSSLAVKLESLFFPIVSNSSMNMIQGAFLLACSKSSLTFAAPLPTNISTNSEPDIEKKGTSASPATAFAIKVFPVPGGPTSKTPLGHSAPMFSYFSGLSR